jgi:RNA polymerase sigma factor (sigma-70 family)
LREAKDGELKAREQVVRRCERLIRGTATHYRGLGLPPEDLVQEGAIGLLRAIDSFDEARGASFETFARWHIRHAITDALTTQARLVRLPKQMVERRRAVTRAASELTARSGHAPTSEEITAAIGLPIESVQAIQSLPTAPSSLDEQLTSDGGTVVDRIEDPTALDPEAEALALQRSQFLGEALERLPERERQVIERRFGLGFPAMTLVELSRELNLCPQRTRAIEQDALYRLAKMLEGDPTFQRPAWRDWELDVPGGTWGLSRRRYSGTRRLRVPADPSPSSGPTRYVRRPRPRRSGASRAGRR